MWNNLTYGQSIFSSIRYRFNNFSNSDLRSGINTFSNMKDTLHRGINSFSNSRLVRFLDSDAFGKIVRNGAEILADNNVIRRKTEDKAMNFADVLRELQHGNYSKALNYADSMLRNDFAEGNHFRN